MYWSPWFTVPLAAPVPPVAQVAVEQICDGMVLGSTLRNPWYPNEPTYPMRTAVLGVTCCSSVKVHSLTAGVFALASTPCGANVLQGVGTPGPQERGGWTPCVIGRKPDNAPVK